MVWFKCAGTHLIFLIIVKLARKITQVCDEKVICIILAETHGFWPADYEYELRFYVSCHFFVFIHTYWEIKKKSFKILP